MVYVTVSRLLCSLANLGDVTKTVQVDRTTATDCLRALMDKFPSIEEWAYEDGELRRQVRFYVNGVELPEDETARPLQDGDELLIFFFHM